MPCFKTTALRIIGAAAVVAIPLTADARDFSPSRDCPPGIFEALNIFSSTNAECTLYEAALQHQDEADRAAEATRAREATPEGYRARTGHAYGTRPGETPLCAGRMTRDGCK
jgi:hypothetical protein